MPPVRCGILRVDRIVVNKSRREMLLLSGESVLRSYRIALGRDPLGQKTCEGDGKTPEGSYVIDRRNPKSAYHRSLHISYPTASQQELARSVGIDPGGDIMIHGLRNGEAHIGKAHLESDWTQGCIAVTNEEMDEIWDLVGDGMPIQINP
jgi:murein L,D-transpeptidase YafK